MSLKPNKNRSRESSKPNSEEPDATSFAYTPNKPISNKTPNITPVHVSINKDKDLPFENETLANTTNQKTLRSYKELFSKSYLYAINAGLNISFASWLAFFSINGTISTYFFPWNENFADQHVSVVKTFVYSIAIALFI